MRRSTVLKTKQNKPQKNKRKKLITARAMTHTILGFVEWFLHLNIQIIHAVYKIRRFERTQKRTFILKNGETTCGE